VPLACTTVNLNISPSSRDFTSQSPPAKVLQKDTVQVSKLPTRDTLYRQVGRKSYHTASLGSIMFRQGDDRSIYRLYHRYAAAAAAAAAASAVCFVSTKSWTDVIFTLSPEDLSVKMKIDSLANEAPPGPSPCIFD
jgi:hypothetical protein